MEGDGNRCASILGASLPGREESKGEAGLAVPHVPPSLLPSAEVTALPAFQGLRCTLLCLVLTELHAPGPHRNKIVSPSEVVTEVPIVWVYSKAEQGSGVHAEPLDRSRPVPGTEDP